MKVYKELDAAIALALNTKALMNEPFNDQYLNTDKDNAKAYPIVFFELLEPVPWTQASNDYQQAKMRARLHCVVFDITTEKEKIHDFSQEVFEAMHQIVLPNELDYQLTTEWVRVGSSLPKRYKNLKVLKIDFEFEAFDYSTLPVQNFMPTAPGFSINP